MIARAAALLLLVPLAALAEEGAVQLWLDHAVSESDHVVAGRYAAGSLTVSEELKGTLHAKTALLARDDVEPRDEDLAPGTPRMKGAGVFFLLGRFDVKEETPAAAPKPKATEPHAGPGFIAWNGSQGVAWEGTQAFLGYRPRGDDRLVLAELAPKEAWAKLLASSLAKQAKLDAEPRSSSRARARRRSPSS